MTNASVPSGIPAIQCTGISKRFGSVLANNKVDFSVQYGEIMALLGENGSGKTTLMNILSGIYRLDEGSVYIGGAPAHIYSPADSICLGIGMIHQHFKLVEVMSAFENILLGAHCKNKKSRALKAEVAALCKLYGLEVSLDKRVYDMSISEKQTVEVLKVLYRGAKILILDEPTAVLTPQEITKLFAILRKMRQQGCAVVIITHKLNEVMEISDRVTVLRKGESVATVQTAGVTEQQLTETMVGRPISLSIARPAYPAEEQHPLLTVSGLDVDKSDGTKGLQKVSFVLNSGEILGVAGVAGSGQKELSEAIVGLAKAQGGSIRFGGVELVGKTTSEIYAQGISLAFVPEDRLGMGLVGSMGMVDNMMLKTYKTNGKSGQAGAAKTTSGSKKVPRGPLAAIRQFFAAMHSAIFINRAPAKQMSEQLKERLAIQTPGIETPVRLLSGGNVQKVLIGREIESCPEVLITAYPVRGLDINSSYTIYDLLNEQKMRGCGVIFVGEDLDVLLELADRILVLCNGQVTGIVDAKTASKEEVGLLMAGVTAKEAG